jgi:hypothetical protein
MQIKAADDRQPHIDALEALLTRPDADASTRKRIEQEIRNVTAGWKGERDAAYEIEFYFGKSRNYATIHDLRIEHDGQVAQIDHLVIDRLLDVWVCESKHFSEGVSINEHGEWVSYFAGRPHGIPSPVEQNRRHILLLQRLFDASVVKRPRRVGFPIKPALQGVVLVSNNARIGRPKRKVDGVDRVIKAERLQSYIDEHYDDRMPRLVGRVVWRHTLEQFARDLAALHRPISVDWAARFGLPPSPAVEPVAEAAAPRLAGRCASCNGPVTTKEAYYCRVIKRERFGGKLYCRACQPNVA